MQTWCKRQPPNWSGWDGRARRLLVGCARSPYFYRYAEEEGLDRGVAPRCTCVGPASTTNHTPPASIATRSAPCSSPRAWPVHETTRSSSSSRSTGCGCRKRSAPTSNSWPGTRPPDAHHSPEGRQGRDRAARTSYRPRRRPRRRGTQRGTDLLSAASIRCVSTATPVARSSAVSRAEPGSPSGSVRTRSDTRSSLPRSTRVFRCPRRARGCKSLRPSNDHALRPRPRSLDRHATCIVATFIAGAAR